LYDHCGNKIFENDILKLKGKIGESIQLVKVVFGDPHAEYTRGWKVVPITSYCENSELGYWANMPGATCEVIGNMIDDWSTKEDIERMMAKMKGDKS
jgi:hypothetical protein